MNSRLYDQLGRIYHEVCYEQAPSNPRVWAKSLSKIGLSYTARTLRSLFGSIMAIFGEGGVTLLNVPSNVLDAITITLEGRKATTICDPWAGIGLVLGTAYDAAKAKNSFGFTEDEKVATVGRSVVRQSNWLVGDPLASLKRYEGEFDVVASRLPDWRKPRRAYAPRTKDNKRISVRDNLGQQILIASSLKLKPDGIGIFVLSGSFFYSETSVYRRLADFGLGIEAAFELSAGSYLSPTRIEDYLIFVRRRPVPRMFVGVLPLDDFSVRQLLSNLREGKSSPSLELGRFVDPLAFRSVAAIRNEEDMNGLATQYGPPKRLADLTMQIDLGADDDDFKFAEVINAVYIPVGNMSDVTTSLLGAPYPAKCYAQVQIDPEKSSAEFVSHYFNSRLGRVTRSFLSLIPRSRLSEELLGATHVFVPDMKYQRRVLRIDHDIATQASLFDTLTSDLDDLRDTLWKSPQETDDVARQVDTFLVRFSESMGEFTGQRLDKWIETLPFPLASILRAWQATPSEDYKTKYEHLLHFFEAAAEFLSIILISAFGSDPCFFGPHKDKLDKALANQNLSFQKATFGTWKLILEYLSKQTRQLLQPEIMKKGEGTDNLSFLAKLFADPSLALPRVLGDKELPRIFSDTNQKRNDWSGHGGVVGQDEAKRRNEQLLGDLQRLRTVFTNIWKDVELIYALHCKPRRGMFENEIAILMGSNGVFLKEARQLSTWLDVECLYLARKGVGSVLRLIPLVLIGPSPSSAKNACYFFNRIEKGGLRYISYHSIEQPEIFSARDSSQEIASLFKID